MKNNCNYLLPALALAAFASPAWAEKEVVIRRIEKDSPRHIVISKDDEKGELEKVAYLGVETAPVSRTLGAQLGLPRETGLVVTNVAEKSPAAESLKQDDVLVRLDDQLLINMHQLGVLVRARHEGDEVKLTVVRGGKELTVKAKLAVRDLFRHANMFFRNGDPSGDTFDIMQSSSDSLLPGLAQLRELPGIGPEGARDVLRMIEHERGNFMTGPGVHIIGRSGKGSTIVDLPKSNISYSDDEGSIEIKVDEGKRHLTVKDAKGTVAFDGPINTDEERKKLPPQVSKRLEKIESDTLSFDVSDDFSPEVVPLPAQPAKTKILRELGAELPPAAAPAVRPF